MALADELWALQQAAAKRPPEPYTAPSLEDVEALYDRVVAACRDRADAGCLTLGFHWAEATTSTQSKWEASKRVIDEVVRRLRAEGLHAEAVPEAWPERTYNEWSKEVEQPWSVSHRIKLSWDPSGLY